jgi:hypothetical protein
LRCFVQSLVTDLVAPRIASAGEMNFAVISRSSGL